MTEEEACLLFSSCDGLGPKTFLKLLQEYGSAVSAWDAVEKKTAQIKNFQRKRLESFQQEFNREEYLKKLKRARVKVVGYTSASYPEGLKQLPNPPIVLYCKGNLELLKSKQNVGVVGARKITSYGKEVTETIVSDLVSAGITIVSGLAFGVDATAHKVTLDQKGNTIAVLGCGVDCCTPAENQDLYEHILDHGGLIISEYPLGMPATIGTFPARNRVIAALSLGILVTEAAEDSGSLITADEAVKLGKPIFAVPGPINSMMAKGTLKLLKQRAKLVSNGEDIINNFQFLIPNFQSISKKEKFSNIKLSPTEKRVVETLMSEPLPLDLLSKQIKIPVVKLMVLVTGLELRGILEQVNGEIRCKM
ncbi:MAG: DNA-processing protein DprA [Candidatus Levyibacteriota bacterium]